jgi:anti-sigma-K factor RskA
MSAGDADDDLAGLAGLYALDALDDLERARFERYLAEHPEVQDEVAGFRATAARLGATAAEPAPSAMRASVVDRLGSVRQEAPRVGPAATAGGRSPVARVAATAAAVLLVVAVGVGGFALGRGNSGGDEVAEVLARPDAAVLELQGDDLGPARVVVSPSDGRAVLVAADLAAPPAGSTYELWRVRDEVATSVGTFDPDDEGTVTAPVELDVVDGDLVAVTVEPAGGSEQPTLPIVLSAEVQRS